MAESKIPDDTFIESRWAEVDGSDENMVLSFSEVYKLYGERVLNLAYRLTHGEDVARDLTQDVFMKVYQHIGSFRERSQIYTWIHRIAVNHILNYLKRERRYRWLSLMDEKVLDLIHENSQDDTVWRGSDMLSPHQMLEASEREKIVTMAIDSLAMNYRVPFVLYRYEEMSYQEIADTMNLSLSAVEARIHRAKRQLIKKLKPWIEHL